MRIIKDNSDKEYQTKCPNCKSEIAYKIKDVKRILGSSFRWIECPVCKEEINLRRW